MLKGKKIVAFPPGVTIKEQLIDRNMSQKEFAVRIGLSQKHISKLINGEVQLTMDVARKLEMVLGLPAQFWCNLETIYRERLSIIQEEIKLIQEQIILHKMPYDEMERLGWIPREINEFDKIIRLRKYFEVAELAYLKKTLLPIVSCRQLSMSQKDDYDLLVWVQKLKLIARTINTQPIHLEKLEEIFPQIVQIRKNQETESISALTCLLAECGIALVVLPHLVTSFNQGATFIDNRKIILGLALEDTNSDVFWLSLYHECAHILKRHIFAVAENRETEESYKIDLQEKEADEFARKLLSS